MKQIFKTLVLVAAAVATLTSCEKAPEVTPAAEEFTLTVNATLPAPEGTKTYLGEFDGEKYPVLWSEGDKIRVSQVPYVKTGDVYAISSGSMSSANSISMERFAGDTKATFTLDNFSNDPGNDANHFDYLAIYGGSDYGVNKRDESQVYFAVTLPATQTPTEEGQFAPNAALMGAMVESTTQQTSLNLDFNHLAAYAMLNVKLNCGDTEKVESVTITSGEYKIAGAANWYYLEGTKLTPRSSSNAVQSITVDMKGQDLANNKNFEVYFTAIPTQFKEGDSLTFVVTTDQKKYTKSVEVTDETVFAFVQGKILDFSVDFGTGEITTENLVKEKYVLVTSVSDLTVDKEHEIILVVKNGENKYLTAQATPFSKKYNSIEINDVDGAFTLADDSGVEIFTLIFENEKGWKLRCKNKKFLCHSSGTDFAQKDSVTDDKGYWTIAASEVEGATNKFTIANYSSDDRGIIFRFGTYNQFGAYSKGNASNAGYTEPYIYKKVTE